MLSAVDACRCPSSAARSGGKPALADGWKWIGLLSMGWFSSMFVLTLARDAGLLLTWLAGAPAACRSTGRAGRRWSAAGGAAAGDADLADRLLQRAAHRQRGARRRADPRPAVRRCDGFTIAQLSDIHVGADHPARLHPAHRRRGQRARRRHGRDHRRPGRRHRGRTARPHRAARPACVRGTAPSW